MSINKVLFSSNATFYEKRYLKKTKKLIPYISYRGDVLWNGK